MRRLILTIMAAVWWLLAVVGSAFAAGNSGGGEQVGENLGNMLGGWAKSLYAGIAGIVAVMFLFNRRFAELAVFVGAAIVVGGFVLAPGSVSSMVHDIWATLTG
jgi:hypothetical protein